MIEPREILAIIFVFVVTMTLLRLTSDILKRRHELRARELELKLKGPAPETLPAPQLARIEERLRVLERIATDADHQLAREIDALRDTAKPLPDLSRTRTAEGERALP